MISETRGRYINISSRGQRFNRFFSLLRALVVRDVTSRYRRSSLGMWWAFIQPLVLMLLFNMLRGFVNIPSDGAPYILFSYAGLVPWTFFTNSVSACGPSIIQNAEIIKKISMPREVFPLAAVFATLFDFGMSSILLAILIVWFKVSIGLSILWTPFLVILMIGSSFAIGILLAGLGTFRKDFIFASPFLMQAWLFITPVIYPLNSVPEAWRSIYMLNPMVGVIEGFRSVLIKGDAPEMKPLIIAFVMMVAILSFSWPLFRKLSEYFADVL
ncbi:MAG: ABC transporter permease [Desulfomonilaceae bacterium]